MTRITSLIVSLLLAVSIALPSVAADENFAATIDTLAPYYINEDADLSVYDEVLVADLKVNYARVIAPPWFDGADKGAKKWQLTDKDVRFLRDGYRQAMTEALEREGGYVVVSEAAENVIILDVEIITLMPYARKGEKVKTRGFGELRAQATLRDGVTGELLGIFEGAQQVGSEYQQNTRLNAENNLRALFDVWGMRMRKVMDDSRE